MEGEALSYPFHRALGQENRFSRAVQKILFVFTCHLLLNSFFFGGYLIGLCCCCVDCSHDCAAEKSPPNPSKILLSPNLSSLLHPFFCSFKEQKQVLLGKRRKAQQPRATAAYSFWDSDFSDASSLMCSYEGTRKDRMKFQLPFHVPL